MQKLELYLYKNIKVKPIVLIVVNITSKKEVEYLEEYSLEIFKILVDNKIIKLKSIVVFILLKQYNQKKSFLIQPSVKSDTKLVDILEKDTKKIEKISFDALTMNLTDFKIIINDNKILITPYESNLCFLADLWE